MMMTRKKRIAIIGIIVLALLIILFFLLSLFRPKKEVAPNVQDVAPEKVEPVVTAPKPSTIAEQTKREQGSSVGILAKLFVERYGSYSTQSDFQNLKDLMSAMSTQLAEQTRKFIDDSKATDGFYGITTRVITFDVQSLDEDAGTARVLLNTQREEANERPQDISVFYQEIELELIKEAGIWKVASASWL